MPEWNKDIFAKNLRYYLDKSGKTQKEIAQIIGVSAPTINEYLNGKKMPRIDKIQKLADYFGVLKSDLIEDKTNSTNEEYYLNPETKKVAQEIFDNKELSLLFDAAKDASPEDIKTIHSMLLALKAKDGK